MKPEFNQNFSTAIDQRDIGRVTAVNLASMRRDMVANMRLWVDDQVSAQCVSDIPSSHTTALDNSNTNIDNSTGKVAGGSSSQQTSFMRGALDWIDDLEIQLSALNASPGLAGGDVYDLAVVMPPAFFRIIRNYLLLTYDNTDLIVLQTLRNAATVLNGAQYRGTLFGRRLYTTGSTQLTAQDATADDATELYRMFAIATGSKAAYDTAVVSFGGVKYGEPDVDHAKHRLRMEIELAYQVVESNGLYQCTSNAVD